MQNNWPTTEKEPYSTFLLIERCISSPVNKLNFSYINVSWYQLPLLPNASQSSIIWNPVLTYLALNQGLSYLLPLLFSAHYTQHVAQKSSKNIMGCHEVLRVREKSFFYVMQNQNTMTDPWESPGLTCPHIPEKCWDALHNLYFMFSIFKAGPEPVYNSYSEATKNAI